MQKCRWFDEVRSVARRASRAVVPDGAADNGYSLSFVALEIVRG